MLVPYNVDVPMERWPITNWAVIAVTLVAHVLFWGSDEPPAGLALWRGDEFAWWQPVSYALVHADWLHLLGNMMFLFVFGNAVNARFGHAAYLGLYLLAGIASGLAWLAVGDGEVLVGASGAIMGVVGAFLVYYPRNDISIFYWFGLAWTGTFDVSAYLVIGCYVAWDVLGFALLDQGGVAYIAHVVGAGAGFGMALACLGSGVVKPGAGEEPMFSKGTRKSRRRAPDPPETPRARPLPGTRKPYDDAPIPLAGDEITIKQRSRR